MNGPWKYLFNLSLENGLFPEKRKFAKVIPLSKNGDPEKITKYQYLFFLVFLIITNIYAKKNYYTQSSLDSKRIIPQTTSVYLIDQI